MASGALEILATTGWTTLPEQIVLFAACHSSLFLAQNNPGVQPYFVLRSRTTATAACADDQSSYFVRSLGRKSLEFAR